MTQSTTFAATFAARRASRPARRWLSAAVGLTTLATTLALAGPTGVATAAGPSVDDWLGTVNVYRAQSGLPPVVENAAWSTGTRNHSCWMLLNGIAHDETPGTPGYTPDGDQAGNSGNVAVSSNSSATARGHIDLWMTGPFHAIGLLRPSLQQAAYGMCASPPNPTNTQWRSAATLDVVRGNNWGAPKPASPIVFPGNGATTSLTRFIAETPDPRSFCGWGAQSVGLPLIAMMPSTVTAATASLVGPNGPIPTCVLHRANTSGVASSILGGDNAVVVVPASPLTTGTYSVAVSSNGGSANWSFNVDPTAQLGVNEPPPGTSRTLAQDAPFQPMTPFRFADSRLNQGIGVLAGGQQVRVKVAGTPGIPADATAISASFTITEPNGPGFLTAYNCLGGVPAVSTLNYGSGETVSNQAIVPLDRGDICLFSLATSHVVVDINGFVSPGGSQTFHPVQPKRLHDTRYTGKLLAGVRMTVPMTGGASPVPVGAQAVAVNLTAVEPSVDGWIRAFPCDRPEPSTSSVSARSTRVIASSVIVPVAADGSICLTSMMETDVVVDVTGWFGPSGLDFIPIDPIRLADTRSFNATLNPWTGGRMVPANTVVEIPVAGIRGVPAGITGATVNLVALGAYSPGWLRIVPCGSPSDVSNLNFSSPDPIANGANVRLSASGTICVVGMSTSHILVDITGVWK
jgi:uncharacterized protein YkwD